MKRIYRNALIILVILMVGGAVFFDWQMGLSVGLGGLLAVVNFHWMVQSVDRILLGAGRPKVGPVVARFLGRLVLILLGLFAIIQLPFLSAGGAVAGLSIFVLSGMLEAILILFEFKAD